MIDCGWTDSQSPFNVQYQRLNVADNSFYVSILTYVSAMAYFPLLPLSTPQALIAILYICSSLIPSSLAVSIGMFCFLSFTRLFCHPALLPLIFSVFIFLSLGSFSSFVPLLFFHLFLYLLQFSSFPALHFHFLQRSTYSSPCLCLSVAVCQMQLL